MAGGVIAGEPLPLDEHPQLALLVRGERRAAVTGADLAARRSGVIVHVDGVVVGAARQDLAEAGVAAGVGGGDEGVVAGELRLRRRAALAVGRIRHGTERPAGECARHHDSYFVRPKATIVMSSRCSQPTEKRATSSA